MEQKIYEFENYMISLTAALDVSSSTKLSISREVEQNLYDKYNEQLIKGYDKDNSILYTLASFENPVKLAKMLNTVYGRESCFKNVGKNIIKNKGAIAVIVAILLMTLVI